MDKIMQLADELSNALMDWEVFREYRDAIDKINADPQMCRRIDNFKRRHLNYVINKSKNFDSFDEERYLSQEYYKIILNENARVYFENGLEILALMNTIYKKLAANYALDVFLGEE